MLIDRYLNFRCVSRHGCEQCRSVGAMSPDGSVGECDVCHAKRTISVKQLQGSRKLAVNVTFGPDHPHIEDILLNQNTAIS
ncbi:MAG: hypothetical protein U5K00_08155 [Melioribacteraceae bacterium]|nr:hypothetical protein [Melioribacteraceae bacterium]